MLRPLRRNTLRERHKRRFEVDFFLAHLQRQPEVDPFSMISFESTL